jgi:hypothetical protein
MRKDQIQIRRQTLYHKLRITHLIILPMLVQIKAKMNLVFIRQTVLDWVNLKQMKRKIEDLKKA